MKKFLILIIILSLSSCSPKGKSKGTFKITLGNLALTSNGGSYINFIDLRTSSNKIVKLDADNNAIVPSSLYQLIAVSFSGPDANSGPMLCGSVASADLSSPEVTITLNVSANECLLPLYASTILELKKGITSKWDNDLFDLSHWGP